MIEAKAIETTHNHIKARDGDISFVAVFLAHVCFMMAWGILVYFVSCFCKALEEPQQNVTQDKDEIVSIKTVQQHPCKKCQFFKNNYYLKCAVNPSIALTKEALNCSDYKSR
ncbi:MULTISPECIES: hypothetical protein [Nostoc]|uniref:Uncharacterized protein n=1 Tax=Nostoc paludosum FACHB-159 TaxID=2692908 RepID=A0ABR8KDJ9_9NOSO|nr:MULTISPECIES: hypothetical protein [Nostoc]MBD2680546.1 hypothetical protein [Nostoc sp. FACHB-857]MBD2736938.1 hypothetical protein [Nostoc paludosum FACHB-159]